MAYPYKKVYFQTAGRQKRSDNHQVQEYGLQAYKQDKRNGLHRIRNIP